MPFKGNWRVVTEVEVGGGFLQLCEEVEPSSDIVSSSRKQELRSLLVSDEIAIPCCLIGSSKKQILQVTSPEDTWLSCYDDVSGTRGSGFESQYCQPFLTSPIVSSESESGGVAPSGDGRGALPVIPII